MATFDWPDVLTPQTVDWGIQKSTVQFRSPFAGSLQSLEYPGQFWRAGLVIPGRAMRAQTGAAAFFSRMAGGVERVRVPYWPRMVPLGTMRGAPVLAAGASRGDLTLQITTTGTLRADDVIGVGGQLFQVFADAAPVSGTLTVTLVNRVRATIASGSAVVWNRPTVEMIMPAAAHSTPFRPGARGDVTVDLEEAP